MYTAVKIPHVHDMSKL